MRRMVARLMVFPWVGSHPGGSPACCPTAEVALACAPLLCAGALSAPGAGSRRPVLRCGNEQWQEHHEFAAVTQARAVRHRAATVRFDEVAHHGEPDAQAVA